MFYEKDEGMKKTANLGLKKPDGEDYYNVENMNENMDIIDEKIQDIYHRSNAVCDEANMQNAFYTVFTKVASNNNETALSADEIETALHTEWSGETSDDETALSADEIETALHTEWSGETSDDETALSAAEIETALST